MSRLTVLLMISSMRGGGSERQTLHLLKHLDRDLFVPHLYVTERAGSLLADVPADVQVHSFDDADPDDGVYFPGKELRRQSDHIQKVLSEHAINVVYDRTFQMSLVAHRPAYRLAIPRVSTIVSPPEFALPHVEKKFVSMKRRRLSRAYRRAAAVVTVSKQSADSAASYYRLDRESLRVILNPVDLDAVRQSAAVPAERDSIPTFVCVARMTAEKGHTDLIQALSIVRDHESVDQEFCVRMVGDGPLRTELETQVDQLGLESMVQFCGHQDDAIRYLAAADAMILPSRFEGMPNVVLEAMAVGTPVIATKSGGTVELQLDEPTAFWADPGDPVSLAAAIVKCMNEPHTAANHVAAATRLVQSRHDVRQTTRQIESVLTAASRKIGQRVDER